MKVLIIEDKSLLVEAVEKYLESHKIETHSELDGLKGYEEAKKGIYDVIVLDLMLPNKDGLTIIKDLRLNKIDTPILVLTAKVSTDDKVACLMSGADDYMTKPFVLDELRARLFVLTRRRTQFVPNEITYGNLHLDRLNHSMYTEGHTTIQLSLKEYQIMEILLNNTEKIIEKDQILRRVWSDRTADEYYNSCEVYISFLRRKLEKLNANVIIKSVRNVGYKVKMISDEIIYN